MTAKQKAELHQAIEEYLTENGPKARELMEQSIERSRADAWEAENRARLDREREQNGTPEPRPNQPARVVAVRSFQPRGNIVEIGSIWLKSHDCVRSAADAFVDIPD